MIPADQLLDGVEKSGEYIFRHANAPENAPNDDQSTQPQLSAVEPQTWEIFLSDYVKAQEQEADKYRQVQKPQHVSEVTPWLKSTGIHVHLRGLDLAGLPIAYSHPIRFRSQC